MPTRRFLILDDDATVGQTIQWIAEGLGFEAEFVTHAVDFFQKLDQSMRQTKRTVETYR
jgi:FixJ family two-component response regulator